MLAMREPLLQAAPLNRRDFNCAWARLNAATANPMPSRANTTRKCGKLCQSDPSMIMSKNKMPSELISGSSFVVFGMALGPNGSGIHGILIAYSIHCVSVRRGLHENLGR